MPKDVQEEIMSVSGKAGAEHFGATWDKIDDMGREHIETMPNKEIITLSKEEMARWMTLAEPIHRAYIKKIEAKGLPGSEALDFALERIKEYSK